MIYADIIFETFVNTKRRVMLKLKNIVKKYVTGDSEVIALGGVSLNFRRNEFVSILGASGCGKTTMLNIIGGLDRYTDGDLVINGKSTKEFLDRDWDHYRNHSVGFVFQSYNLIPHQSVLSNVELALTLSGVSKAERRARAAEALAKVGLGDQLEKRPSQMSGGQMQRVAIARALVNNPDILLADEPTGALDTTTSVQIMELLKEVARDRLVIMVTHNPELAEEYSTRIVRLRDGLVVDDSDPFEGEPMPVVEEEAPGDKTAQKQAKKNAKKKAKKNSMSFLTALSLSKNNLMTKKGRTILTSFAGSIGIIGIALILSISNGIQGYIDQIQEDTLSTYPLTVKRTDTDFSAMMSAMTETAQSQIENPDPNTIYVDDSMATMMSAMSATVENDLKSFKAYIDANYAKIADSVSDIQYTYDFDLQIYTADGKTRLNPTDIFSKMPGFESMGELMSTSGSSLGVFSEMINNQELLDQQYELVGENSHWPTNKNEVVLVVGKNNQISAMTLYMLGVLPQDDLTEIMNTLMQGGEYTSIHNKEYSLDDFLGMEFYMLSTSDFYTVDSTQPKYKGGYPVWRDMRESGFVNDQNKPILQEEFIKENGTKLTISGIVRPKPGVSAASISGAIGYTKGLTDLILEKNTQSSIINQQKETPSYNVLTGKKFEKIKYTRSNFEELIDRINMDKLKSVPLSMLTASSDNSDVSFEATPEMAGFFLAIMEDKPQKALVEEILAEMKTSANPETPPASLILDQILSDPKFQYLPGITLTSDNLPSLLPALTTIQRAAVFTAITGLYSGTDALCERLNEEIPTWTLNKKILEIIPLMIQDDQKLEEIADALDDHILSKDATLESNLKLLGDAEMADPASINFYAKDFESKANIEAFIKDYNDGVDEDKKIEYTDLMGILMSSISVIIDVISYVLIAFVSISLIVSSIMIGIITYISVLERTKEIGILRSIGASKKDISRVFNAETLIVGFVAGLIGILSTILLCIPINAIIRALSGVEGVRASLPVGAAIVLVAISMLLTFIAGLIPSRLASKKDPVEALRSE